MNNYLGSSSPKRGTASWSRINDIFPHQFRWLLGLLFFAACFTLAILPFWNKAIIPARFILGFFAICALSASPSLRSTLYRVPAFWGIAAYAVFCILSTLVNGLPLWLAGTGLAWLCVFLGFWVLGSCLAGKGYVPFYLMGATALLMLTAFLVLGREGLGIYPFSAYQHNGDRLVGLFQDRGNRLAAILAAATFFTMMGGLGSSARGLKKILISLAIVLLIFMVNVGTRMWLLFFVGTLGLYLWKKQVPFKLVFILVVLPALLILGLYCLNASNAQLYTNPGQALESALSRLPMWKVAWLNFLEHPFLGLGPEQFRVAYCEYFTNHLAHLEQAQRLYAIPSTTHAHNIVLSPLVETGLAGCAALMVTFFSSIRSGLKKPGITQDAAVFLIIVFLVGMLNPALDREAGTIMAAVFGLAAAKPSAESCPAS